MRKWVIPVFVVIGVGVLVGLIGAGIMWTNRATFCRQFQNAPLICASSRPPVPPTATPTPAGWCNARCITQDDCADGLYCQIYPYSSSSGGVCGNRDVCGPERICTCEGANLVCPTFTSVAVADCAVPAGLCSCSGLTIQCPSLGISSMFTNTLCYAPPAGCGCSGPDYVCNFGGETLLSERNAPQCGAARLGYCYALCDPAAPNCDAGLTCTPTEDGYSRCLAGVDSTGYDCTTWPSLTGCYQRCDPAAPNCDPGLSCLPTGVENFHACMGGTDTDGVTCTLATSTPATIPPGAGGAPSEPTFTSVPAAACGSPCTSDAQCAGLGPNPACAGGACYDAQSCGGGITGGTDGGALDCSAVGQRCNLDPDFGACPADYTCGGPYDEFNYGTCQRSGCP